MPKGYAFDEDARKRVVKATIAMERMSTDLRGEKRPVILNGGGGGGGDSFSPTAIGQVYICVGFDPAGKTVKGADYQFFTS